MAQLSIALTIPGEAALGTFEAGALSALLVALQCINERDPEAAAVDVMTGASSGSLTAVVAVAALLTGADPVAPLRRAWVSEPSLTKLSRGDVRAPLNLERAREVAHNLLGEMLLPAAVTEERRRRAQPSAVELEFSLTCLRGFSYQIPQPHGPGAVPLQNIRARSTSPDRRAISATSYIDWAEHRFGPDDLTGLTEEWSAAIDSAVASASLPLAFPPMLLDRSRQRDGYLRRGVSNLPAVSEGSSAPAPPTELWYADGGLVDREPVGRCLQRIRARAEGGFQQRVVLVVRPCPENAPSAEDDAWTGQMKSPRWRTTLARGLRILVTHSLYEDLHKVERTNTRIAWTESLIETLEELLRENESAKPMLAELVRGIQDDNAELHGGEPKPVEEDLQSLLRQSVRAAAGLEDKHPVAVDVVAARDDSELSGAAVGFVSERLRATDFLVGYQAMLRWMETGLGKHGVPHELADEANQVARDRGATIPGWIGEIPLGRPPVRVSAELLRVGVRAARAGLSNPRARGRG